MSKLFIGTSGYSYNHWVDDFYPLDVASNKRLDYYAQYFNSVEINNSFYHLPQKKTFQKWAVSVPDDFVFSIKANRYITHMKNLMIDQEPINKLLDKADPLKEKLGPILFQLPPQWKLNFKRLKTFIDLLPQKQRFVIELRNKTWYTQEVFGLLKKNKLGFCIHDHQDAPSPEKVTSDFVYLRFHGPNGDYQSKYSQQQMEDWAKKIKIWQQQNLDVFIYFNNDFNAFAIDNAEQLKYLTAEI
jgi:uncharacterized protein YecE (DUF72 family)